MLPQGARAAAIWIANRLVFRRNRVNWAMRDGRTAGRVRRAEPEGSAMAVPRVERRLAAILAADVVGYGRLMRADEEGTLAALQAHRRDLVDPLLADHRGRIVKLMGDGVAGRVLQRLGRGAMRGRHSARHGGADGRYARQ